MGTLGEGRTEASVHVGMAGALRVLEHNQESAIMRLVISIIDSAPGVDVHSTVGRNRELSRMTNLVGKNTRAESLRQTQPSIGLRPAMLFAAGRKGHHPSQQAG